MAVILHVVRTMLLRPRPSITPPHLSHQRPTILLVEDDRGVRTTLRRILEPFYVCREAERLVDADRVVHSEPIDLVLLDLRLPDGDGLDWLRSYVAEHEDAPVVVVSGEDPWVAAPAAIESGAVGHLAKPCRPVDVRSQVLAALAAGKRGHAQRRELNAVNRRMFDLPNALAQRLVMATSLRDGETGEHVLRMRESSRILARALGLGHEEASAIGQAAVLHDVGKMTVPDGILRKPGRLTPEERTLMEQHTVLGARILHDQNLPELALAETIARSHHERWDGAGYPDRLAGEACPLPARIVAAVDVYDALSHARVYKAAWAPERVRELFVNERGRAFEPRIVDALLTVLPELEQTAAKLPDTEVPTGARSSIQKLDEHGYGVDLVPAKAAG